MDKKEALALFRYALDKADEQLEAEMVARTGEIIITREQHETGVNRIMEAFRRYKAMKVKRRIVIVLLAAVLIVLTSCTIYVNRDRIAAFVENFYDTYVKVSYDQTREEAPKEILEVYMPSYIPEGYELIESHSNAARVRTQWENGENGKITFDQALLTDGLMDWDNEKTEPKILIINDISVYCAQYNNAAFYMWNDGNYSYKLMVTEDFVAEEIERLITLTMIDNE